MLRVVRVQGESMMPGIRPGRCLIVESWSYRRRAPRRGEVVVLRHPSRSLLLLKRVTVLPGEAWRGRRLGPDEFVVEGDNRATSTDGRDFGSVRRSSILGRVLV